MRGALICHHVEPMWEKQYNNYGSSFEVLLRDIAKHIRKVRGYAKVIVTRFEEWKLKEFEYAEYLPTHTECQEYGYGWEMEEMERSPQHFCEGGSHSEAVYVPDWLKELPRTVYLCGAFDGECIEDITIALEHAKRKVVRIPGLIL